MISVSLPRGEKAANFALRGAGGNRTGGVCSTMVRLCRSLPPRVPVPTRSHYDDSEGVPRGIPLQWFAAGSAQGFTQPQPRDEPLGIDAGRIAVFIPDQGGDE
jgi:hypothetical protein